MLRGALAAAVTPLDGDRLDEDAFAPYVEFLAAGRLDGVLALGTTGEGFSSGRRSGSARWSSFSRRPTAGCRWRRTAARRRRPTRWRSRPTPQRRARTRSP